METPTPSAYMDAPPPTRFGAERGSDEELKALAVRLPQMATATALLDEQIDDLVGQIDGLESRLAGVMHPSGDGDAVLPSLADAGEFVRWPREILMQAERTRAATLRLQSILARLEV